MLKRSRQSGDTLIEVLFAVTVFSLVVVSALTLMNQGTATIQRSLEVTLVRQQIDSQADTLRFLQSSYVNSYYSGLTFDTSDGVANTSPAEEFYKIIQQAALRPAGGGASDLGTTSCGSPPEYSFIIDTRAARVNTNPTIFSTPETSSMLVYDGSGVLTSSQGLWIEPVRSVNSSESAQRNTGYIDFHIRACWDAPALDQPMNLGTIVRLYEPRG
jgi:type II secretory pathway pseudopilin PulG